jgi:prophage antirepressor-like protein
MNNFITVFNFEQCEIRFVDGKPVANDVAKALGYIDPATTIYRKVDPEYKRIVKIATVRYGENKPRMQEIIVLEEAAIYQLIFGSKIPSAKKFQKWVFEEVLPNIRRTGSYTKSQISHPYQRIWYQRLALFEQTTRIPVGYFCIFAEIAPLMRDLEANSILLRDNATIDTSVGLCWNQWLRANNLFENFPLYPHTFPDNRGTINAKIYPDRLLPEFRSWLRMSYLNGNFPNYIKKQCSEDECLTIAKALGLEKQLLSA